MQAFKSLYNGLIATGTFLQSFFLLGIRLFWGWEFAKTGLGKFGDINSVATFFQSLGLSPPLLHAYAAASVELICGSLLLIGLGSRLAAIPLMVTMVVALLTAHREATMMIFDDPTQILGQLPITFLMASLIVFLFGPGMFSVDALLKRFVFKGK